MTRIPILVLALLAGLFPALAQAQKLDETPRTMVMTAFHPEWNALVAGVTDPQAHTINGNTFLTGLLEGKPVILMQSGVSVVNAAMATQLVLDRFAVRRIVFSGIAGGVDPALSIGDVVVPQDWGQYLEASFARKTAKGWVPPDPTQPGAPPSWNFIFPRGTVITSAEAPPRRLFRIPADPALLALTSRVAAGVQL